MHGHEKSDPAIVAVKPTNKAGQPAAELVEPRAGAEGNVNQQSTGRAQYRGTVSQALARIRQAARQRKKEKFTALFHHVSIDHLAEAFSELKENAAAGVDGLTCRDTTSTSSAILRICMLASIGERMGHYRRGGCTYPSRTAATPIGVAALEDKIVQRAHGCGAERDLGGRFPRVLVWVPTRTQHARCDGCARGRDHQHKGELDTGRRHPLVLRHGEPGVAHQVRRTSRRRPTCRPPDPEMAQGRRAGRREVTVSDKGTAQGAVISPLLANSTCTTLSTCGPSDGDGVRPRERDHRALRRRPHRRL